MIEKSDEWLIALVRASFIAIFLCGVIVGWALGHFIEPYLTWTLWWTR